MLAVLAVLVLLPVLCLPLAAFLPEVLGWWESRETERALVESEAYLAEHLQCERVVLAELQRVRHVAACRAFLAEQAAAARLRTLDEERDQSPGRVLSPWTPPPSLVAVQAELREAREALREALSTPPAVQVRPPVERLTVPLPRVHWTRSPALRQRMACPLRGYAPTAPATLPPQRLILRDSRGRCFNVHKA